jgi:predicted RNA-binding protein with RPS1 domain
MLELNGHYSATVVKILERGAVVTISGIDGKTGFIHISNVSESFVSNISDYLAVGQTYDAVCTDTEKFSFSVKHLGLERKHIDAPQKSNHQSSHDDKKGSPQHRTGQPPEFRHDREKKEYSVDDMIARANASLKDKQKHKTVSNSGFRKNRSRRANASGDID